MSERPAAEGGLVTGARRIGLAALLLLAGGWDALRAPDPDVDSGNQAFRAGRYDEALGHYRSAEARGGDPRLHFDTGAALYKLGEKSADDADKAPLFQQAEEEFRRAADTDDAALKARAYYNLGNTLYQRRRWEDAIAAYRRALRADPGGDAARHNLEMALRQREKRDQSQEQSQDGQQGQKGKQGQKDPKQGQGGSPKQQPGQDQPDQGPQDSPPDGQEGDEGQAGPQGQPPQDGQGDQDQGQEPQETRPQQGADDPAAGAPPPDPKERERAQGQESGDRPAEAGDAERAPSDQDRKLDELERRSRDLRKRLLRQSGKTRDPLRLPSRRDW
jgi:Ca-activated chloride channel family protein